MLVKPVALFSLLDSDENDKITTSQPAGERLAEVTASQGDPSPPEGPGFNNFMSEGSVSSADSAVHSNVLRDTGEVVCINTSPLLSVVPIKDEV